MSESTSRSSSPTLPFIIEQSLRQGDIITLKGYFSVEKIPGSYVNENLIVDCSKGIAKYRNNRGTSLSSVLFDRFKCWKFIIERLDRTFSLNEMEAILYVINQTYKDINWKHPFWSQFSYHEEISDLARRRIQQQTI